MVLLQHGSPHNTKFSEILVPTLLQILQRWWEFGRFRKYGLEKFLYALHFGLYATNVDSAQNQIKLLFNTASINWT